ncbi:MAG: hypothetical protein RLZZ45_1862, partial [Bacteroidota bacterium]
LLVKSTVAHRAFVGEIKKCHPPGIDGYDVDF